MKTFVSSSTLSKAVTTDDIHLYVQILSFSCLFSISPFKGSGYTQAFSSVHFINLLRYQTRYTVYSLCFSQIILHSNQKLFKTSFQGFGG